LNVLVLVVLQEQKLLELVLKPQQYTKAIKMEKYFLENKGCQLLDATTPK
jgi:hypothetical protein